MAEKEFELKITVVVSGFGKQQHWEKLAKEVKKAIGTRVGEALVSVDAVRVVKDGVPGRWYDCPIGVVQDFDYEAG